MPKRPSFVASLAVVCLVASACGGTREFLLLEPEPDRVSIKGYSLDLAYGEDPPPAGSPASAPAAPMTLTELAQEVFDLPPARPPNAPPAPKAEDPCPSPGPGVFAERPITPDVDRLVAPGVYLFQQAGSLDIVGLGKVPLDGLTSRVVRNITGDTESFDFEVELAAGLRRQVQAFRVVPGDGIFIRGIRTTFQGDTTEFKPLFPVEVFPLPAVENTALTGAGVDPATGETMVAQGTITRKQRVLGCSEVVDGWLLEGTWTFQAPGVQPVVWDLDYTVATQHGGLVVADHLATTESYGPVTTRIDVTSSLGSIHPRPEPGGRS